MDQAKEKLLSLLKNHSNDATDPLVLEAINKLNEAWINEKDNESKANPLESECFLGIWQQISAPDFPERITTEDKHVHKYTLGRLTFNVFEPNDMICTLKEVKNIVKVFENDEDKTSYISYTFHQSLILHTNDHGDLPASIIVEGKCYENKKSNRVSVCFGAGELRKGSEVIGDAHLEEMWSKEFDHVYSKASQGRGLMKSISRSLVTLMFDMTLPSDDQKYHRYEMKRAPKGFLDILYIDNDLRITKGNRGTIVVAKKLVE